MLADHLFMVKIDILIYKNGHPPFPCPPTLSLVSDVTFLTRFLDHWDRTVSRFQLIKICLAFHQGANTFYVPTNAV